MKDKVDTTLFIKNFENNFLVVQVYVDDIIFGSTNKSLCESFAKSMNQEFEISIMGKLTFFLGLQIKQLSSDSFLSQTKYALDLLKMFNMDSSKAINTPMSTSTKLDIDESGDGFDQKTYRGVLGSLLYLIATRSDIIFSIGLYARFQSNHKLSHLKAIKRIFRYLKGTTNLLL